MLALYLKKKANTDQEAGTSRGSEAFMREALTPHVLPGISFDPTTQSSAGVTLPAQNRRLLPNTQNALHVIDGPVLTVT
ncbi:Hypothetical predicted protein [Podarcis lilfordi]|uniref:Uncharacterized protein n=1 Tax=Podarcis lilfordi TaxID=74358 RepID=A0AA35LNI2_9SAUR|nr:Hypothetical predicted protein [Podarcis lilfordi]